VMAE